MPRNKDEVKTYLYVRQYVKHSGPEAVHVPLGVGQMVVAAGGVAGREIYMLVITAKLLVLIYVHSEETTTLPALVLDI